MQPGDTITPQGETKPAETSRAVAPHVVEAKTEPEKSDSSAATNTSNSETDSEPAREQADMSTSWQYASDGSEDVLPPRTNVEPVSWSASEFVDNEKNASWFMSLAGISFLAVVVIYFITRDPVTVVVVGLAAVLFAVTAKRKPRTLEYRLDERGIQIGQKGFPYETFKSFSVLEEGAFNSIQLMPLKRFMPPISLYFPPEDEEKIVNTLGSYLPHEERTHDPIERLMRKVRF